MERHSKLAEAIGAKYW